MAVALERPLNFLLRDVEFGAGDVKRQHQSRFDLFTFIFIFNRDLLLPTFFLVFSDTRLSQNLIGFKLNSPPLPSTPHRPAPTIVLLHNLTYIS